MHVKVILAAVLLSLDILRPIILPSGSVRAEDLTTKLENLTIQFNLYTKDNAIQPQVLLLGDENSLKRSNFNKAFPTRFIIHGFDNNCSSELNYGIRDALLGKGQYNVVCVNWGSLATNPLYPIPRGWVPDVGRFTAKFIDFVNQNAGMLFESLKLIGHSLGAHVAGFAGKSVKNGRVNTIIGLDPALPLFDVKNCAERLCRTDANYVEIMHTSGGSFGIKEPIGNTDFYVNGGTLQPNCTGIGADLCSHLRAYMYYPEALKYNDFSTIQCNSYEDALNDKCGDKISSVRMGAESNFGLEGIYYVPINDQAPYGKNN